MDEKDPPAEVPEEEPVEVEDEKPGRALPILFGSGLVGASGFALWALIEGGCSIH